MRPSCQPQVRSCCQLVSTGMSCGRYLRRLGTTSPSVDPGVGQPCLGHRQLGRRRPRLVSGDVEVAVGHVAAAGVAITPRMERHGAVARLFAGDHEVVLPTFAAERQRVQQIGGTVWHRDLVLSM